MSDYINPDLMALLLKWLPVKTLLRSRSVCKQWKQLIDSNSFIADHLAVQIPRLIAHHESFKYLIIDPHNLPKFDTLQGPLHPNNFILSPELICCVHGVICLQYDEALHLWNPSIRRLLTIPLTHTLIRPISHGYYFQWFSFWIDPSNNQWKIATGFYGKRKIRLFSSTKRAWTEIDSEIQVQKLGSPECGGPRQVLINGVAYWTASVGSQCDGIVVYFDFTEDEFGTIEMPGSDTYNANVFKWNDSLSLVHWINGCQCICTLWAMQNGSWEKMFIIKIDDRLMDILYMEESSNMVLAETERHHMMLYDSEIWRKRIARRSKWLKIPPGFKTVGIWEFSVSYDFVESLVFPDQKCISSD